ncbi:PepSY domain-containing protein [Paraglaciecola sp. MB-3u-78]|uniref:PepSY domain-containing protein n=1 Tax=Paraglaciecola sp. MB-3u-78 TaxID=2058332 RepID=UPI000C31BCCA|nr:PepSY domain-containing protein [Paraglaciecola sp. MB-3u-78]PKG96657.1 PepSY domain-containing protein [Paraglaciecola sp. MB-3u-78]
MNKILSVLLIAASLTSTASFASNNCKDPIDTWQPQKNLQQKLAIKGWQVDQIKIDDGCYEVKGLDTLGNRFEAIFLPASLNISKLEIKFKTQGAAEDYLDKNANTY